MNARIGRLGLRFGTVAVLLFLYLPIAIIALYAFDASRAQIWPIAVYTTSWFGIALQNQDMLDAFGLSIRVGLVATAVAVILGTLAAFAIHRFSFFGRSSVSFLLVLPLALPGIVTGMALNATINATGIGFSALTIVVGHATFCIVVAYNNVIARLRRSARSIEEASMDLGATTLQTFRYVTLPVVRTAILAGGLLAFALSFDEVVVTIFTAGTDQTLPIWIYDTLFRASQRPIVNVVALLVIVVSIVPVYLAQRLTSGGEAETRA
ncbi:MAG: ABC transporter permease [Candidatus Limnocylindrales bacterium]